MSMVQSTCYLIECLSLSLEEDEELLEECLYFVYALLQTSHIFVLLSYLNKPLFNLRMYTNLSAHHLCLQELLSSLRVMCQFFEPLLTYIFISLFHLPFDSILEYHLKLGLYLQIVTKDVYKSLIEGPHYLGFDS